MLKFLKRVFIALLVLVVLAVIAVGAYWLVISPAEVEGCLERGGSWDKNAKACVYQDNVEVIKN